MRITRTAQYVVVLVVVVMIGASAAYFGLMPGSGQSCQTDSCTGNSSTASGSFSLQGGNTTVIATYAATPTEYSTTFSSTVTSATQSTTSSGLTTTSTATSVTSTSLPPGSYTYEPNSQVKILSVEAVVSQSETITFEVQFQNIGTGDIYLVEGGGSALSAAIPAGPNIVTQAQDKGCSIATAMVSLAPGGDHTSVTPGCWSEFHYVLNAPGDVNVNLVLSWSDGFSGSGQQSVTITCNFALS
jgi:hypothetical protein